LTANSLVHVYSPITHTCSMYLSTEVPEKQKKTKMLLQNSAKMLTTTSDFS